MKHLIPWKEKHKFINSNIGTVSCAFFCKDKEAQAELLKVLRKKFKYSPHTVSCDILSSWRRAWIRYSE